MAVERDRERFPTTASVGLRLGYKPPGYHGFPALVLITKKDSGLLGLIAGGIEQGEDPFGAALREAEEEANFPPHSIIFLGQRPNVVTVPRPDFSHIGLIYEAELTEPIPLEGFAPDSNEVAFVKPYSIAELIELVKEPDRWYRPEFNLQSARYWVEEYVRWKYGTWEGEASTHQVLVAWGLT